MMTHLERACEFDIRIRLYDDRPAPQGIVILAEDIQQGVVYERDGVKVTAFDVDHHPVKPALGERIDYGGRSVVLSGDTKFSENLIRFAWGADVVIHSVAAPEVVQRGRPLGIGGRSRCHRSRRDGDVTSCEAIGGIGVAQSLMPQSSPFVA
jgi:ribonuclease Z